MGVHHLLDEIKVWRNSCGGRHASDGYRAMADFKTFTGAIDDTFSKPAVIVSVGKVLPMVHPSTLCAGKGAKGRNFKELKNVSQLQGVDPFLVIGPAL